MAPCVTYRMNLVIQYKGNKLANFEFFFFLEKSPVHTSFMNFVAYFKKFCGCLFMNFYGYFCEFCVWCL